jgi:hypothetical protein
VSHRMNVSLSRDTEYVNNKFILHILLALLNGFTFWKIADDLNGLRLKLFTVFSFIFVAPGLISQLQPLFINRRDVYETREKKSKTYHWVPFVTGLIVSELPYLAICAVLYFVSWYFTTGLPTSPKYAGSTFFVVVSLPLRLSLYQLHTDFKTACLRVFVHRYRTVDCRIRPKCCLRLAREPSHHHDSRLFLWCDSAV